MSTFAWAKLWIETLDDFKMGQLSDHLWRRFFEFVLLAKSQDDGGYLPDPRAMAWRLRCSTDEVIADLNALSVDGLKLITKDGIGWYVTNFDKRQETPMDSSERMRRLRERERRAAYAEDETPPERNDERNDESDDTSDEVVTFRHTDKTRQEKKEERREEADPPLILSGQPPPLERHTLTPDEIPKPDPVFAALWKDEVMPELQMTSSKAVYENWYLPITPVARVNGTALLSVNEHYEQHWAKERLRLPIQRALSGVCGEPVDFQFVVLPPGGT